MICKHEYDTCVLHLLLFWLKPASPVLRALLPTLLTVLVGAISLLSSKVVEDCLIRLPIGFALQPARVVSYPAAVFDGQSTARRDLGVCGCGPFV